jgi:UTP--glucose-1-phosphate uridylyltransferase
LEDELEKAGKLDKLKEVKKVSEMANFIYVRQKGPYGNATPVLSAASLVDNEPFVFVWGDDLVKSKVSFTKQMVEDYEMNGKLMIGVQEVPKEAVSRYGIVKLREGTDEIEDIIEKPSIEEAPSQLADFGRMILDQSFINILKETSLGKNNELWITDAIKKYVQNGGIFLAKEIEDGEWLTTGDPLNYLKALLAYAAERKDIGQELKKYTQKLFC